MGLGNKVWVLGVPVPSVFWVMVPVSVLFFWVVVDKPFRCEC